MTLVTVLINQNYYPNNLGINTKSIVKHIDIQNIFI